MKGNLLPETEGYLAFQGKLIMAKKYGIKMIYVADVVIPVKLWNEYIVVIW